MVDQILNTDDLLSSMVKHDLTFEMILIVKSLLAEQLFLTHEDFWLTIPKLFGITQLSAGGVRVGPWFKRYCICCGDKPIVC